MVENVTVIIDDNVFFSFPLLICLWGLDQWAYSWTHRKLTWTLGRLILFTNISLFFHTTTVTHLKPLLLSKVTDPVSFRSWKQKEVLLRAIKALPYIIQPVKSSSFFFLLFPFFQFLTYILLDSEPDDQIDYFYHWWPCLSQLHGQWIWASRGELVFPCVHKPLFFFFFFLFGHCAANDLLICQRVEFPMPSNNFSFSLANRCWDLLNSAVYRDLFNFDKVCSNYFSLTYSYTL